MLQGRKTFVIGIIILTLTAFLPVSYERTIRDGTDSFETHHALWGKRVQFVSDVARSPLGALGLILVNLRHSSDIPVAHIRVLGDGEREVFSSDIPVVTDDEFTWFPLPRGAVNTGDRYTVEVSAPTALVHSSLGVRFDKKSTELALGVRERIPLWEKLLRWTQDHHKRFLAAMFLVKGGALLTLVLLLLEYSAQKNRQFGIPFALIFLACVTLYMRIPLSQSLGSAYGGDAFNYILKGNAWIVGEDPFAADPRKAPLYSFLVAPGLLPGLDPILFARGISIIAAMGTVVLVALFLLRVGTPLSLALGGGMLLAVNRDYQFESIQGLSNSLYAFLILASAYAFIVNKKYLVSVCAALATLTRYEGFAAAGILLPAMWMTYPSKLWNIVREALPFLILCSIPFLLTPLTGNIGVRTFSDLTGDEGLYIAHSWEYFLPSIQAFKIFFGRLWILTPGVGNPFAAFGWGALLGIAGAWFFHKYGYPRKMLAVFPSIICIALLSGTLWGDGSEIKFFIAFLSGLTGLGAAAVIYYNARIYLPVVLMVLTQTVIITAILPKNRYYLHILPFIAMAIAGSIWLLGGAKKAPMVSRVASLFALSLIVSFVYANAGDALSGQFSDYNEKSVEQTVEVEAGRYLKKASGKAAIYDGIDLPIRTYLTPDTIVYFSDALRTPQEQYAKIKDSGAVFLLHTSEKPYFTQLLQVMPEKFQEIATFKIRWSDVSATLYRIY